MTFQVGALVIFPRQVGRLLRFSVIKFTMGTGQCHQALLGRCLAAATVPAGPNIICVSAASFIASDVVEDIGVPDLAVAVETGISTTKGWNSTGEAMLLATIELRSIAAYLCE
jgi:hypothetical protein